VIRRVSSWINQICKMPTLEATSNTETKEVYMNGSGLIRIHPDMTPIITLVDSVQYKMSPINGWVPLTITDISVFQRYFTIYNPEPSNDQSRRGATFLRSSLIELLMPNGT